MLTWPKFQRILDINNDVLEYDGIFYTRAFLQFLHTLFSAGDLSMVLMPCGS